MFTRLEEAGSEQVEALSTIHNPRSRHNSPIAARSARNPLVHCTELNASTRVRALRQARTASGVIRPA